MIPLAARQRAIIHATSQSQIVQLHAEDGHFTLLYGESRRSEDITNGSAVYLKDCDAKPKSLDVFIATHRKTQTKFPIRRNKSSPIVFQLDGKKFNFSTELRISSRHMFQLINVALVIGYSTQILAYTLRAR